MQLIVKYNISSMNKSLMRVNMITVNCSGCKKEFKTYKAWIKKGAGIHCGRICQGIYGKKKPKVMHDKICLECGKEFKIRQGYGGTGTYCSKSCRSIGCGKLNGGENHPNWKGGISARTHSSRYVIRKIIAEKGSCETCGSINNLHGHHIKSYSEYPLLRNEPNNIKVVCANCHATEHPNLKGMISIPRIRSGSYLQCVICGDSYYKVQHLVNKSKTCSRKCSCINARRFRKEIGYGRKKEVDSVSNKT